MVVNSEVDDLLNSILDDITTGSTTKSSDESVSDNAVSLSSDEPDVLNESISSDESVSSDNAVSLSSDETDVLNDTNTPNESIESEVTSSENHEDTTTQNAEEINVNTVFETNETKELALKFINRYLNLMLQKKTIAQDVKALKSEFEEQGVPTALCIKASNTFKAEDKMGENLVSEIDTFKTWFSENKEVCDKVTSLNAKS